MVSSQHVPLSYPEPVPVAGDVVLRSCDSCPSQYELCPNPAPPQIRCAAYEAAVQMAKRWACHEHVDVWVCEGQHSFALVSRHRHDGTFVSDSALRVATAYAPLHRDPVGLGRPNALLIGSQSAARALMAVFRPHLSAPVAEWDPALNGCPPPLDSGTLVIWNADAMQRTSQERLLDAIREHRGTLQIISVAGRELFDCVQRGEFHDELYYYLNVVRLHVEET